MGALKKLGGTPKICILQNQWERGAPKKLNRQRGELLKFQASSFNIFISPPCHIKCTFPYILFFFVGWEGKGQQICIHFHTLLKCVTIILLCIAGEASGTIVHKQLPQMNTAVTTTAQ